VLKGPGLVMLHSMGLEKLRAAIGVSTGGGGGGGGGGDGSGAA
jgi:hypothetical protein